MEISSLNSIVSLELFGIDVKYPLGNAKIVQYGVGAMFVGCESDPCEIQGSKLVISG